MTPATTAHPSLSQTEGIGTILQLRIDKYEEHVYTDMDIDTETDRLGLLTWAWTLGWLLAVALSFSLAFCARAFVRG